MDVLYNIVSTFAVARTAQFVPCTAKGTTELFFKNCNCVVDLLHYRTRKAVNYVATITIPLFKSLDLGAPIASAAWSFGSEAGNGMCFGCSGKVWNDRKHYGCATLWVQVCLALLPKV
jgi:hypothetical protein